MKAGVDWIGLETGIMSGRKYEGRKIAHKVCRCIFASPSLALCFVLKLSSPIAHASNFDLCDRHLICRHRNWPMQVHSINEKQRCRPVPGPMDTGYLRDESTQNNIFRVSKVDRSCILVPESTISLPPANNSKYCHLEMMVQSFNNRPMRSSVSYLLSLSHSPTRTFFFALRPCVAP